MNNTIVYIFSLADIAIDYAVPFIIAYIVIGIPILFIINLIRGN